MSDVVRRAELFAERKHLGQLDKAGAPYIEHPRAVAGMLHSDTEKAVAYLHDTVEDTDTNIDEIRGLFGDQIAEAVDLLTRKDGVPYMDYIRGIKSNELARAVKIADLIHNSDLSRFRIVTDEDVSRVKRYRKAYELLQ